MILSDGKAQKSSLVDVLWLIRGAGDGFDVDWPHGAYVRVLLNSVTQGKHGDPFSSERKAIGTEDDRTIWLFSTDSPLKSMTCDFEAMALYAGEGIDKVDSIIPAAQRLNVIVTEAQRAFDSGTSST